MSPARRIITLDGPAGVGESTIAKRVANSISSVMPLFVAGLFYFVFNAIVAWAMEKIEKRMSYYH